MDNLFYKVIHNKYLFLLILSKLDKSNCIKKYENIIELESMINDKQWSLIKDKLENNKFIYISKESIVLLIKNCKDKIIWSLLFNNEQYINQMYYFNPISLCFSNNNRYALKFFLKFNNERNKNDNMSLDFNLISTKVSNHNTHNNHNSNSEIVYKMFKIIFKYKKEASSSNSSYRSTKYEFSKAIELNQLFTFGFSINVMNKLIDFGFVYTGYNNFDIYSKSILNVIIQHQLYSNSDIQQQEKERQLILLFIKIWNKIYKQDEEKENKMQFDESSLSNKELLKLLITTSNSNLFYTLYLIKYNQEIENEKLNQEPLLNYIVKTLNLNLLNILISKNNLNLNLNLFDYQDKDQDQIVVEEELLKFIKKPNYQNDNEIIEFFNFLFLSNFKSFKYYQKQINWQEFLLNSSYKTLVELFENNEYFNKLFYNYEIINFEIINSIFKQDGDTIFSNKSKLLLSIIIKKHNLVQTINNTDIQKLFKPIIDSKEYIDHIFENSKFYSLILSRFNDTSTFHYKNSYQIKFKTLELLNYFMKFIKNQESSIKRGGESNIDSNNQDYEFIIEFCYYYLFQKSISECDLETLKAIDELGIKFEYIYCFPYVKLNNYYGIKYTEQIKFYFSNQKTSLEQIQSLFNYLNNSGYKSFTPNLFNELIRALVYYGNNDIENIENNLVVEINYQISCNYYSDFEINFIKEHYYYSSVQINYETYFTSKDNQILPPPTFIKPNLIKNKLVNVNFNHFKEQTELLIRQSVLSMNADLLDWILSNFNKELDLTRENIDYVGFLVSYKPIDFIYQPVLQCNDVVNMIKFLINLFNGNGSSSIRGTVGDLFNFPKLFSILFNSKGINVSIISNVYQLLLKNQVIKNYSGLIVEKNGQDYFEYHIFRLLSIISENFLKYTQNFQHDQLINFLKLFNWDDLLKSNQTQQQQQQQLERFDENEDIFNDNDDDIFSKLFKNQIIENQIKSKSLSSLTDIRFLLVKNEIKLCLYYLNQLKKQNYLNQVIQEMVQINGSLEPLISKITSINLLNQFLSLEILNVDINIILKLSIKNSNIYLMNYILSNYNENIIYPINNEIIDSNSNEDYQLNFKNISMFYYILSMQQQQQQQHNNNNDKFIDFKKWFEINNMQEPIKEYLENDNSNILLDQFDIFCKSDLISHCFEKGYWKILKLFLKFNSDISPSIFFTKENLNLSINNNRFDIIDNFKSILSNDDQSLIHHHIKYRDSSPPADNLEAWRGIVW